MKRQRVWLINFPVNLVRKIGKLNIVSKELTNALNLLWNALKTMSLCPSTKLTIWRNLATFTLILSIRFQREWNKKSGEFIAWKLLGAQETRCYKLIQAIDTWDTDRWRPRPNTGG